MKTNQYIFANLDDAGMQKVRTLEEAMGAVVLVMERKLPVASLSEQQVERIKSMEEDLGVVLVAYQS